MFRKLNFPVIFILLGFSAKNFMLNHIFSPSSDVCYGVLMCSLNSLVQNLDIHTYSLLSCRNQDAYFYIGTTFTMISYAYYDVLTLFKNRFYVSFLPMAGLFLS